MSSSSLTPRAASGARLGDDRLDRPAAVLAAQLRDDAEGAVVVAALGDLHVGVVLRRGQDARRRRRRRGRSAARVSATTASRCRAATCADRPSAAVAVERHRRRRPAAPGRRADGAVSMRADDRLDLAGAEHDVDLGDLGLQLVAIAFGQAAGHHQLLAAAVGLVLGQLEDRVDRFLLGPVDERAGVDHQHVGLGRVLGQLVAGALGEAQHHLGVDEVLRAAERDEADLHVGCSGARTPEPLSLA